MQNNKSPNNDGLTIELQKIFLDEIKYPLKTSMKEARLRTYQRQAVIQLVEKKEKDKPTIGIDFPFSALATR